MKDYTKEIVAFFVLGFGRKKFRSTAAIACALFLCSEIGVATTGAALFATTIVSTKTSQVISSQSTCESGAYTSEKGDVVVMLPRQTRHFRYVSSFARR